LEDAELERLLSVLEAEEKGGFGSADDNVNLLWRAAFDGIQYVATDGVGDEEGTDGLEENEIDTRLAVVDLVAPPRNTKLETTGSRSSMTIGVPVAKKALRPEADAIRARLAETPEIAELGTKEAVALRNEALHEKQSELLDSFIDVLLVILADPLRAVSP